MKICPNCGAENDDNALTCILCEFEFDFENENSETGATANNENVVPDTDSVDKPSGKDADMAPKSSNKPILIAIASALVVFLGVGGIFLMMNKDDKKSDSSSNNAPIATTSNATSTEKTETTATQESATETTAEASSSTVTETSVSSEPATENTTVNTTVREEPTEPAAAGNKINFYPSEKINDYPAYIEKLKDLKNNGIHREQDNGYFLCDINADNMPELFVTINTNEPGILFAGSIYSGELVPFAEFTGAGMLRGITLFDNGAIGIASAGGTGNGMSYKYYSGGNSFSDQNNNDEYISYVYENGALSYVSYQNGGQEKHISEAEAEQIQKKYVEAAYTAAPVSSVIQNGSSSAYSDAELGFMYNRYYINVFTGGSISGGYIFDYDNDGTDELICTSQGALQILKYQNGDIQNIGQASQNISSSYYERDELENKCLELATKYGYGVNSGFVSNSEPGIGYVATSDMFGTLNLRKGPSTDSEIITQLPNGLMFNSSSNPYDKSAFCYITTTYKGQTYSGYVSSDYIKYWEKGL